MSISIGVVAMAILAALSLPAHAISDEAIQELEAKGNKYCLTGTMTGWPKHEVQAILRKSRPLCRKYRLQLQRIRKAG